MRGLDPRIHGAIREVLGWIAGSSPGDDNGAGMMSVEAVATQRRRFVQWGIGLLAGGVGLELLAIGWLTPLSPESWIWLGLYRGVVFHAVLVAAFALVSVFGLESRFWFTILGAIGGFFLSTPIVFYAGKLASGSLSTLVLAAEPLAGAVAGYLWSAYAKRLQRQ